MYWYIMPALPLPPRPLHAWPPTPSRHSPIRAVMPLCFEAGTENGVSRTRLTTAKPRRCSRIAAATFVSAAIALLSGLSPPEILGLRWDQIDFASGKMKIAEPYARTLTLDEAVLGLLSRHRRGHQKAALVLERGEGQALREEDLDRLILCAAYDAGIDELPARLRAGRRCRHTYLLFLPGHCAFGHQDIDQVTAGMIPREEAGPLRTEYRRCIAPAFGADQSGFFSALRALGWSAQAFRNPAHPQRPQTNSVEFSAQRHQRIFPKAPCRRQHWDRWPRPH